MPIVDRRLNDRNKSLNNRNKYLDRIQDQLKDSVRKAAKSSNIKDLISSKDKRIILPGKGLSKPSFTFKRTGGILDHVAPGNKKYEKGDLIPRPPSDDEQQGKKGGNGEDSEDDFEFSISKEKFFDIYFEDMELPDLVKKQLAAVKDPVPYRAGYKTSGASNRLNILQSMKRSTGRRFALQIPIKIKIDELENELEELNKFIEINKDINLEDTVKASQRIDDILLELSILKGQLDNIPFLDETDLRYNRWEKKNIPITQAVMFAVMDVSGSMGEREKELAKCFFIMLALFLQFNYERIDIKWIRHTTVANIVSEEEFFNARDNGGTQISSALKLVKQTIAEKYSPVLWNIFVSQISDGDNYEADNEISMVLLEEIIPLTQYYTYIEIDPNYTDNPVYNAAKSLKEMTNVMQLFNILESKYKNVKSASIADTNAIYPVFKKLFEKKPK